MPIEKINFTNVGPFDNITFEFDQQVNVFTGPNNSGKSTALWALGELLVYPFIMPERLLRSDTANWALTYSSRNSAHSLEGTFPAESDQMSAVYELIGHTSFVPAQRATTGFRSPGPVFDLDIEVRIQEELDAIMPHISSSVRRQIGLDKMRELFRDTHRHQTAELAKRRNLILAGPLFVNDKAVIQKMIDLDYSAYREQQPAKRAIIEKVVSTASQITEGFPLEFVGINKDEDGLFPQVNTPDGKLPLGALSQGTQSLIHCLAHFIFGYAEYYDFPPDLDDMPAILIIDEIDAHLHPSWQRRIIPTLTNHFPKLQIFCSTHSPLMLAGLKAGQVQLLQRDEKGKVTVSSNESDISGWTADEILRNFLEVGSPTDLATADRVRRLQELRRKEQLSTTETAELEELRKRVSEDVLASPVSAQIKEFTDQLKLTNSPPSSAPEESG